MDLVGRALIERWEPHEAGPLTQRTGAMRSDSSPAIQAANSGMTNPKKRVLDDVLG